MVMIRLMERNRNLMKRDIGISYNATRKIHYNIMRFKDTLNVDEVEVIDIEDVVHLMENIMSSMDQKS